jgi:hypothetical protein
MGGARARRDRDTVDALIQRVELRQQLLGAAHVAQRPERRMAGGEVDHIGPAALRAQTVGQRLQRRVGAGFVLAMRIGVQRGAEQPLDQHIARAAVERVVLGDALLLLDVAFHPELRGEGGGEAAVIRLHRAGDQHRIRPLGPRGAEIVVELAHLVAAKGEVEGIVALDQQRRAAIGRREPGRRVERRRPAAELRAGQRVEAAEAGRSGHGVCSSARPRAPSRMSAAAVTINTAITSRRNSAADTRPASACPAAAPSREAGT